MSNLYLTSRWDYSEKPYTLGEQIEGKIHNDGNYQSGVIEGTEAKVNTIIEVLGAITNLLTPEQQDIIAARFGWQKFDNSEAEI